MKKILALVLAMMLVLSMSAVAFADGETTEPTVGSETTASANVEKTFYFNKKYVSSITGAEATVYPAETLQFTSTADSNNPDKTDAANLKIEDQTVDGNPDKIAITVPAYTKVGSYVYTIQEVEGKTHGVTYSAESFKIQVLVTYIDDTHTTMERQIVFYTSDGASGKIDTIVNKYDVGTLAVNKTVTGNLGDETDSFDVYVTFTVDDGMAAKSDITYKVGTETKTVTAAQINAGEKITITVKHGETITFENIPAGVNYTVVEEGKYATGAQDANKKNYGYDAAKYSMTSVTDANATTTSVTNEIAATKDTNNNVTAVDSDKVFVINNKGTEVATGISLDNMPYVIIMGLVVLAGAAMLMKKRSYND